MALKFREKDVVGDGVKGFTKIQDVLQQHSVSMQFNIFLYMTSGWPFQDHQLKIL